MSDLREDDRRKVEKRALFTRTTIKLGKRSNRATIRNANDNVQIGILRTTFSNVPSQLVFANNPLSPIRPSNIFKDVRETYFFEASMEKFLGTRCDIAYRACNVFVGFENCSRACYKRHSREIHRVVIRYLWTSRTVGWRTYTPLQVSSWHVKLGNARVSRRCVACAVRFLIFLITI